MTAVQNINHTSYFCPAIRMPTSEQVTLTLRIASLARMLESWIVEIKGSERGPMRYLGCLCGISAFRTLRGIVQTSKEIPSAPGFKKVEKLIDVSSKVVDVADYATCFAWFLKGVGAVTEKAIAWTEPLEIACIPLDILSLGFDTFDAVGATKFSAELKKTVAAAKWNEKDVFSVYRKAVKPIYDRIDNDFISEHFSSDVPEFARRLTMIETRAQQKLQSSKAETKAEGKEILKATVETLKNRVTTNCSQN